MEPSLSTLLAPGVAFVISVATFAFTQYKTQTLENRSAAKDTVELLAVQNTALHAEVSDLRTRLTSVEAKHDICEQRLTALLQQLSAWQSAGTNLPGFAS